MLPRSAVGDAAGDAHRPWPAPRAPWVLGQSWHDLLFAHWPVDPAALRPLVPADLPIDTYEGHAWVGVVPFTMVNVRLRATPALPPFPELNVRTYTTVGGRPGVYFFSLDAANRRAVLTARQLLGLPYHRAEMSSTVVDGWVDYRSRRSGNGVRAELVARYRPIGDEFRAEPGSLAEFLTERYCLYTVGWAGGISRLEIAHPPWPLQPAEAVISAN